MTRKIATPHDRFFTNIWSRKRLAQNFLRHYLPAEVVALLDLRSLELTKSSFVDEKLRSHYSDLLYRLLLKDGSPALAYVLVEHKSTPEWLTAFQVLRYLVRIWEEVLEQTQGQGPLPPIIPVVVYHGENPWPYGQTLQEALRIPEPFARYTPDFSYVLCDLAARAESDLGGAARLRAALLLMKYIRDARLAERLPEILGLLEKLAQSRTALEFVEVLLSYVAAAATQVSEDEVRRAIQTALPNVEETLMATLAEKWLKQGWEKGQKEGWEKGREEGLQAGQKRGQAALLIRQLELRFGTLPESYRARIEAADTETLLIWGERVLAAHRLEEVFL